MIDDLLALHPRTIAPDRWLLWESESQPPSFKIKKSAIQMLFDAVVSCSGLFVDVPTKAWMLTPQVSKKQR